MSEVATQPPRTKARAKRAKSSESLSVTETSVPPPEPAPRSCPIPSSALIALRQHLLDSTHQPLYATRRQQLQSALAQLDSLARKLRQSDETQQAALSVLYELLLTVAERFSLLLHGVNQLSAMNRASSLQTIREARRHYRDGFDEHVAKCSQLQIDVPVILHLLAELSRESL